MLVTIPEEVIFLVLMIRTYPKLKNLFFLHENNPSIHCEWIKFIIISANQFLSVYQERES